MVGASEDGDEEEKIPGGLVTRSDVDGNKQQ